MPESSTCGNKRCAAKGGRLCLHRPGVGGRLHPCFPGSRLGPLACLLGGLSAPAAPRTAAPLQRHILWGATVIRVSRCLRGLSFPPALARKWKTGWCVKCQVPKRWGPESGCSAPAARRCAGVCPGWCHLIYQPRVQPSPLALLGAVEPVAIPGLATVPSQGKTRGGGSTAAAIMGFCLATTEPWGLPQPWSLLAAEVGWRHRVEASRCPCCLQGCISSPQEQHNCPGHPRAQLFVKWTRGKGLCKETLGRQRKGVWGISAQLSFLLAWSLSLLHSTLNSCSCMGLVLAVTLHRKTVESATLTYSVCRAGRLPFQKRASSGPEGGPVWAITCMVKMVCVKNEPMDISVASVKVNGAPLM